MTCSFILLLYILYSVLLSVKQTLSDNVSILSASQGTTGSKKYENYASSGHPSAPQKDFDDYNEVRSLFTF